MGVLKIILFALLYGVCGLIVCYIYKAIDVLETDNSDKWKWDSEDDTFTVIFFPFGALFLIILAIRNMVAVPIIAITEVIRAKRNMKYKG